MNYPDIELKKKRYSELSHIRWAKLHLKIQLILKNYSIHLSMNFFFFLLNQRYTSGMSELCGLGDLFHSTD